MLARVEKWALLLLDGNTAIADADRDAGGLLPLLLELIAEQHGDDGKRADREVSDVTIHPIAAFRIPGLPARPA